MQRIVDRIIKAQVKVFKTFNKMVNRLEKQSNKLTSLQERAMEEINYYNNIAKSAREQVKVNDKQIQKIRKFME